MARYPLHHHHPYAAHSYRGAVLMNHPSGGVEVLGRNHHGQFTRGHHFPSLRAAMAWIDRHHAGMARR